VFAFAGIGRPAKFGETLAEIGAEIAGLRPFPDHHPYSADDVAEILAAAEALDAAPVTTAKDYVRLPSEARGKVVVLEVEARFADTSALARLIESVIPPSAGPAAPGRGA
jgi:tetraacyldisaccharide 4'-kinase